MRAATVIVGAVAVASFLIAISLIVSGGGSGQTVVTKTVIEEVKEPAPERAGQFGGPTACGGGEYTVENTSCGVGKQIHADYEGGRRGELFAKDGETGQTLTFLCEDNTEPITCTSEETGAVVYFGG
ncbi:MAG TPA: hypothetical protein VJL81_07955 [Solirubrobacterales bacterium]|nr:hypothetical protein [Solirubrobacterales bacterium]